MVFDICMIILTAFAVFGGYCLVEMTVQIIDGRDSPPSVTIMSYSEDDNTYKKARFISENIFNNKILFITDNSENNIYADSSKIEICEISDTVTNVLFTKKLS